MVSVEALLVRLVRSGHESEGLGERRSREGKYKGPQPHSVGRSWVH